MVRTCCVDGCKGPWDRDAPFFRFPKSRSVKKKWLEVVKVSAKLNLNSLICKKHFTDQDFEDYKGKRRLRNNAVPRAEKSQRQDVNGVRTRNKSNSEIDKASSADSIEDRDGDNFQKPIEKSNDYIKNRLRNSSRKTSNAIKSDTNDSEDEPLISIVNCKNSTDSCKKTVNIVDKDTKENTASSEDVTNERDAISDKVDDVMAKNDRLNGDAKNDKAPADRYLPKGKCRRNVAKQNSVVSQNVMTKNRGVNKTIFDDSLTKVSATIQNSMAGNKSASFLHEFMASINKRQPEKVDVENLIVQHQIEYHGKKLPIDTSCQDLELDGNVDGPKKPVYIEVDVGKGPDSEECLMVMEQVQVEVDPSSLIPPEPDYTMDITDAASVASDNSTREANPISLLTSSDDDEVIIQEPHIDTIEVSDEDEDDVPLVKLAKTRSQESKVDLDLMSKKNRNSSDMRFKCGKCDFKTSNRRQFWSHTLSCCYGIFHCSECNYHSASRSQFSRHRLKHKSDKNVARETTAARYCGALMLSRN